MPRGLQSCLRIFSWLEGSGVKGLNDIINFRVDGYLSVLRFMAVISLCSF
ncbi:hypothetical protein OIU76_001390 [Salix suchowensis]|uniref:Uncharacterized protein n=1 Tax=Salix purpurea TaxID=77065 RepID=A0A9Q0WUU7_SALPP|nr:hypothetical protein OIU78_021670 [Salix suchowensis]KAJ6352166.1 hypothetical protein OIU76_001390 [Salix suchowensis]KAJ6773617.1 hypothetical protein OIU79_017148 [Salix purpurea]